METFMSFTSLAAIALLSTAAAADTAVEKPEPPAHTRAVVSSEQAGTGSTREAADAAAPQCSPGRESNTASVEARPSTPGEEGIWSATP
jgi:hypothetical protein